MRYIRYAFYLVLAICLVTVAMANRGAVTLHLLPEQLAGFAGLPNTLELPLFVIIFGGIIAGLLVGFVWEWLREHKIRSEAAKARRDVKDLEREVVRLKGEKPADQDEILALLEKSA
ncbi:MAG TPA: DUF1049 domain-containing protein [Rhodobacteraceae bacterium]|jgi:uncharacterized integral membrane protein|nr:DUF1049 domain-containing protein [Paracoccaceae bacterium]